MPARYANLDPRHAPHGFLEVFRWSVLDRLTGRRRVAPPGPPAPRVPSDLEAIRRRVVSPPRIHERHRDALVGGCVGG